MIDNKHCAIFTNLYEADTWEGPEGVRLIEVLLYYKMVYKRVRIGAEFPRKKLS